MKKILIAILALVYMGSSSGAMVHMHYCMGELADWSFKDVSTNACSSCGMPKDNLKNKGCCKDEHRFIKNAADQKAAESVFQLVQSTAIVVPHGGFDVVAVNIPAVSEEYPAGNAPPRSNGVAVYILHRTFLI